ncbi:hypothetical protein DFH11DRAFT_1877157 [Phellopilus nigrolimitatus]|nr:hypothetical protein DFH11DRAFT_1877157 [Phellopilus nigrolimitatus]
MYKNNLFKVPRLIESKFSDAILQSALNAREGEETVMSTLMNVVLEPDTGKSSAEVRDGDINLRGLYSPPNAENGERNGRWLGLELAASEKHASVTSMFFNAIAERVRNKFNIAKDCVRVFSNKRTNKLLGDKNGRCSRKPDVAVLDAGKEEKGVDWGDIRGCFEVKINNNNNSRAEAHKQIRQHACMIFKNQPGRRFVSSATLLDEQMVFILHDRIGELASEEFNIHEKPEKLVRIVVGFAFCTEKNLGYDPSYYMRDGEIFIRLDGQEYQVVRDIYADSSIYGRGTIVRELCPVHDSGAPVVAGHKLVGRKGNCVLKDVWVDKSRKGKEWDLLEDLEKKNFEGVVRMKSHEEVKIDGKLDTTGTDRAVFQELVDEEYVDEHGNKGKRKVERWRTRKWKHFKDLEEREHHFLVLKTLGQPLESFRSRRELISAFRDIFKTLKRLEEDRKLHQDLSLSNVVLVDVDDMDGETLVDGQSGTSAENKSIHARHNESDSSADNHAASSSGARSSPRLRKGVIMNFDFAVDKKEEAEEIKEGKKSGQSRGHRTGTMPFMAIDILKQSPLGSKKPLPKGSNKTPIMHDYYHDLESVFYMLCWLCIAQAGPNSKDRQSTEPFDYESSAIGRWAAGGQDKPHYPDAAYVKHGMMAMADSFEEEVLGDFHNYFEILKEYVVRLREVICPPGALTEAQEESMDLGKSPKWIGKSCKRRPKADVFKWIDKILVEALEDSNLDKDEDEDKELPVTLSLKPSKSCAVQRLSQRRRGEPDKTFVKGEDNEDTLVGPTRLTDEKALFDGEVMYKGNPDENERAPSPTDSIKSIRSRDSMSGTMDDSAPACSGHSWATKRSFVDADIQDRDDTLLATASQKRPREV